MSISGPGSPSDFFDSAYRDRPPWDIGAPQPDMIALLDEYPPTGPVLEVGCGTGDLSLEIARRGLKVMGVDIAEAAIEQARAKAKAAGPDIARFVEFCVGDGLNPSLLPRPFAAVVDSGFIHLFGPPERERFVDDLAAALSTGGRYYLLGFGFDSPFPNAPRRVSEGEVRERFTTARGWRVLALRQARFVTRSGRGDVPAVAACVERLDPR